MKSVIVLLLIALMALPVIAGGFIVTNPITEIGQGQTWWISHIAGAFAGTIILDFIGLKNSECFGVTIAIGCTWERFDQMGAFRFGDEREVFDLTDAFFWNAIGAGLGWLALKEKDKVKSSPPNL